MPPKPKRKPHETVDGWRLSKPLGTGGNAEVWLASREQSGEAALKILHSSKPASERYARFVREISVLKDLGRHPGVLPLREHSLPVNPTYAAPAWLTTPVATRIKKALDIESDLECIVKAISDIALTLATLAKARGIYHRDIKPENLF